MTLEYWDVDQALVPGPMDAELEGGLSIDRYGVRAVEELRGEPLELALAQEEPERVTEYASDDQWGLVEDDTDFVPGRMRAGVDAAPEELALHLELP